MKLTHDEVRLLARTVRLDIPDEDIENVTLRLSALFAAMQTIEAELGPAMDAVDPVPPVYPHEDWNSSIPKPMTRFTG